MTEQFLTIEGFRNWLLKRKSDEIVGIKAAFCRCPISNYLSDTTGFNWQVYYKHHCLYEKDAVHTSFRNPKWVEKIVNYIDYNSYDLSSSDIMEVKASECLTLLDLIELETKQKLGECHGGQVNH